MTHKYRIVSLFVLQALLLSFSMCYAQKSNTKLTEADIPDAVMQTLNYEYPGVKVLAWSLSDDNFVAAFKEDGLKNSAYFSNKGEWLKTLAEISKKELPATITDYVAEQYTDYVIVAAYLQQKPGMKTHYFIETRPDGVGQKMSYLSFSDEGKLLERKDPEGFDPVAKTVADDVKSALKNNTTAVGVKPVLLDDGKSKKEKEVAKEAPKKEAGTPAQKKAAAQTRKTSGTQKTAKKNNAKGDESLDPASIPAPVVKALTKKAQRPEDLKWYKKDTCYLAKCTVKAEPNEIHITPKGVWQKTFITLAEEKITGNMLKHLKGFYKGYRFAEAKKEVRADKQDRIYVSIYEKENYKQKLKTMIIFDKTGKLIKTIDADNFEAWEKKTEEDNSLDRYYAKMDKADGAGEIKPRELPQDVQSYIAMNYPSYSYKNCTKVEDEDFGEIFCIRMQALGETDSELLFFNLDGKYLKHETISQETAGDAEEKIDVPAPVLNAFKTKYPRVIEPEWSINEDRQYEVNFNGAKGKTICVYTPEGALLEVYSALNPLNLTPNIDTYLKKNAKGAKVVEYYSVKKADKKMYYKVVVSHKKTKEREAFWFTNAGKIVE